MAKSASLRIRLSDGDKELIKEASGILDVSMSDFIRASVVDKAKSVVLISQGKMTREEFLDWETAKVTDISTKSASAD